MFSHIDRFIVQHVARSTGDYPVFSTLGELCAHFNVPCAVVPGKVWEVSYTARGDNGRSQRHAAAMAVSPAGNMINIGYARGLFEEAGLEFMADLDGRWHLTDTVDTRLRFDKKEIAGQLQQIFKTSAAIRPDRVRQDYRPEGFWARAMRQVSLCLP